MDASSKKVDRIHGHSVAVKKIDKNKMILPIAIEDVNQEVRILKALSGHENVVQFSWKKTHMLCEGGELLDRILAKKSGRYTENDAARVVRQMLKAAAECHLHGLVHRDMKPEMILPIAIEDVKQEVRILKALSGHENVSLNNFLRLCEGGELLDRILTKKSGRYTENDAARVVRQMLKAAAECHLHGLVHRDMKPEVCLK
uniref:Protein kinase domain-containing protein n=1 Tax=Daucus carota subsp. sativus TaxID=79200 RepID=A0A161ZLX7_DAUCS